MCLLQTSTMEYLKFPNQVIFSAFNYWVDCKKGITKLFPEGLKMGWGGIKGGPLHVQIQHGYETDIVIFGVPQPTVRREYET